MIISRCDQTFFQANTYLILPDDDSTGSICTDEKKNRKALVVDPGAGSATWIHNELKRLHADIGAVLLTHGHADHMWDVAAVAGHAPVYVPQPDLYRLENPLDNLGIRGIDLGFRRMGASSEWIKPENLRPLPSTIYSSSIQLIDSLALRAVAAPGHTEGSSVFLFEGCVHEAFSDTLCSSSARTYMLTGDVIFAGSVGRTDLPGGDQREMEASLRFLVNAIKPDVYILPGHGAHTTMFHETRHNSFLHAAMS